MQDQDKLHQSSGTSVPTTQAPASGHTRDRSLPPRLLSLVCPEAGDEADISAERTACAKA